MSDVWFTRLTLKREDAAIAPLVQELAPAQPAAAMSTGHRLMWSVIPEEVRKRYDRANPDPPKDAAFLWRAAQAGHTYYLLGPRPVESSPFFRIETKPYAPAFHAGDRLSFDLRVNATVARKANADPKGRSKRSDVAMDRMRADEVAAAATGESIESRAHRRLKAAEDAAAQWFAGLGARDGFDLRAMWLDAYRVERLPRQGKRAEIGVFEIRGVLEIADGGRFLQRVLVGFGRAKAFGCGLMLLRRAP
jgi:CRISPR system Cascade subunit CasE